MKNTMIRSLSLVGISLMMALSVSAQQEPKVKISDKEQKYKSEDLKVKAKKEEMKVKAEDLKIKSEKDERKVKAKVRPMQPTAVERTEMRTGETQVRTKEHVEPLTRTEVIAPEPAAPVAVPKVSPTEEKPAPRKYAAKKSTHRRTAARKSNTGVRYITRTKVVRDTVFVPSPPERIVTTNTEYLHDTVTVTRVDTVVKMKTENTYSGYAVPRGNFKKVKLKKDDDGAVWMKRKEDGKTKKVKLKSE